MFLYRISDALVIFQQGGVDEWVEMSRICLGILMKLSHHPNPAIVAMATAKLHNILQARTNEDLHELGYLMFSINKALNTAIESEFRAMKCVFIAKMWFSWQNGTLK